MKSRTVNLYFPSEQYASSLKVAQDLTSQIRAFYFKKSLLPQVETLEHADQYAVYFLVSDGEKAPSIYIGQSTKGIHRLKDHIKQKEFWQFGILFVTDNDSFDKQQIDYLEHIFIQLFNQSAYIVENTDLRKREPKFNIYTKANLDAFVEQISFLLEALGVSYRQTKETVQTSTQTYYQADKGHEARLYVYDGQFVLAEGSILLKPTDKVKAYKDPNVYKRITRKTEQLIQAKQAIILGEKTIKLTEDVVCKSPSFAAELASGSSQNGWKYWKGLDGVREQLEKG